MERAALGRLNPRNRMSPTKKIIADVGQEISSNPPSQLAKTAAKFGPERAKKQRVAILLSKSRKRGAKIPPRKF